MSLSTIVVGVDLSVPSDQALDRASALAQLHGATLVLVHAQPDDAPIENVANDMLEQLGRVSEALRIEEAKHLAERKDKLEAKGIAVELVGRGGPAGEVVATVAKER